MEFLKKSNIDFIGTRRLPIILSIVFVVASVVLLFMRGLNLGLDFTGGTLVEVAYNEPVEINLVRETLGKRGMGDAVVQHFGTTQDVQVRIPISAETDSAGLSNQVITALRKQAGESFIPTGAGKVQQCVRDTQTKPVACTVQLRRVEFVGPQVGDELAYDGLLALIYTLIAILLYVIFRFQWRFALGSVIALAHDLLFTFGFFAATQMEFSLSVLAAFLAVLGYSLNDTIVVFDRIRENFHKMRRSSVVEIMNVSLNQTLSRTIITSGTTVLTLLSLFFFGGEIIRGFSVALLVGIGIGTYSSIYIATPAVLALGISREDMQPVQKEGADQDAIPE